MHDFVPRFSAEKIHWLERNRFLLLAKLFSWRTLLVLAPAIAATELLVLAYSATRGPSVVLAKLSAYAWAARQMPSIAAARRGTQRLRRVSDRQMLATFSDELDLSELGHPAGPLGGNRRERLLSGMGVSGSAPRDLVTPVIAPSADNSER